MAIKNPPPIAAENRRMQAGVARSHGRLDEAIVHLRRAVELVRTHDSAHFELGAHDLGCSLTYRRWSAGGCRKTGKTA